MLASPVTAGNKLLLALISLLHTVSRLTCSHVILKGSLSKVRWQYCAESDCRTLTSCDINEFHGNAHRFVLHGIRRKDDVWKNLGILHKYHVKWP